MKRKIKPGALTAKVKIGRAHPKIDPRLALILALPEAARRKLKAHEDREHAKLAAEIQALIGEPGDAASKKLRALGDRLVAPLTSGLHFPAAAKEKPWPVKLGESYVSAFILSDGSARDLAKLGVKIRSQSGDVFSAFIPLRRIAALTGLPGVRYIELARPVFSTLDAAVPYAQLDTLHTAAPPVTGAGVIVGFTDSLLDIFHPDFRTAVNATRVRFLWVQALTPQGAEAGPPTAPALPGFVPVGGATYGVEYNQATIDAELAAANPPAVPAYQTVRHGGSAAAHGTHVAGIAAGNGLAQGGTFVGGAPGADIIFVANPGLQNTGLLTDNAFVADGFAYIFARAAALGLPCVVNMSNSDNQGPHDGSTLGEQFLDNLLLTPGRAITLSSGNSNNTAAHAAGNVAAGGTTNLVLNYGANQGNSDNVEIWYDGHDRFTVTVTVPTAPASVIGPVAPGGAANAVLPNGVQVQVTSVLNDPRNGDNLISIIMIVPAGQALPTGNWTFALTGTTVINGSFQAWVDRNNRRSALNPNGSAFQAPLLQENTLTVGVPATARRVITVGNHDKVGPPPGISGSSGRGPTRDGRIKPEIATVGTGVSAPRSRNMNAVAPGAFYTGMSGTSMSAPLVAGACALLFECRGAATTAANLKQILEDTAGTAGLAPAVPNNAFGFGFMHIGGGCAAPPINVDVWLRDDASDTGLEPFTGPVAWLSPDIEVLDAAGNPVANPTFHATNRFNNLIRVTVRNRGTQTARNTEVYFYWADPATNIAFPARWNTTGIYTGGPGFLNQGNMIVVPTLNAGANTSVDFAWAPPAPGSNIRGDDHFCLLVRLENQSDPSNIGAGGWASIGTRNNIALHNIHVQPATEGGDSDMTFYVDGSADDDSLIVTSELARALIELHLPVRVLPWRDLTLIKKLGGRRLPFGCAQDDPLERMTLTLKGEEVQLFTDIVGAESLTLQDGIAIITAAPGAQLFAPAVRLVEGQRIVARVRARGVKFDEKRRFVHVAQLSGGQRIGGVSLELRARTRPKARMKAGKRDR